VHPCKPPHAPANDVFWVDSPPEIGRGEVEKTEFSINDLAKDFSLTHRALRFYESRGLLNPRREGRRRLFSRADRDRLALVLKGKRLGFTLTEISQMIDAEAGRASEHGLKLTAEKCVEQIAHFERQVTEAQEALKELRRIHGVFSARLAN
jgi:DNA-binding transcriptional MerR regulator